MINGEFIHYDLDVDQFISLEEDNMRVCTSNDEYRIIRILYYFNIMIIHYKIPICDDTFSIILSTTKSNISNRLTYDPNDYYSKELGEVYYYPLTTKFVIFDNTEMALYSTEDFDDIKLVAENLHELSLGDYHSTYMFNILDIVCIVSINTVGKGFEILISDLLSKDYIGEFFIGGYDTIDGIFAPMTEETDIIRIMVTDGVNMYPIDLRIKVESRDPDTGIPIHKAHIVIQ